MSPYCQKISIGGQWTHQSAGAQSYKFCPINFSQNIFSESGSLSSGQHDDSIVFDENEWGWKHENDGSSEGNLGICSNSEDHNDYKVSARETECQNQLGVQDFSGFHLIVVVPQGVSNDKSKLGYPRDRSACLQNLPSSSHLYGLETR